MMALLLIPALILFLPAAGLADASALIISGVGGSPEHTARFDGWSEGTREILVEKWGFDPERIILLRERETAIEEVRKAFASLKQQLQPSDTFFLFMIGHGSYDTDYKFNISGPDLTAAEYNELLSGLNAGRIVVINGTSASGGSIPALAGNNRVIVTATRSGQERNETIFYGHFIDGLENPAADEDKDGKISVWEAFKYATESVARFYNEQGRLATEHPQISDNGAPPTGIPDEDVPALARATSFQVDRPVIVSDPRLQALFDERREIEEKMDALRQVRTALPEAEYERQMEDLLVELALKNQQIRQQEGGAR